MPGRIAIGLRRVQGSMPVVGRGRVGGNIGNIVQVVVVCRTYQGKRDVVTR